MFKPSRRSLTAVGGFVFAAAAAHAAGGHFGVDDRIGSANDSRSTLRPQLKWVVNPVRDRAQPGLRAVTRPPTLSRDFRKPFINSAK